MTSTIAGNRVLFDENNRGPLVNITTWIMMVAMCSATGAKVLTKCVFLRKIQQDDGYMLAAMIITIAQGGVATAQVKAGLGQHMTALTSTQVDNLQKAIYVSQIFYIVSICLARQATLQFLSCLGHEAIRHTLIRGVMVFNVLWVAIAFLALAFQCHIPQTWAIFSDQCFNQHIFWHVNGALDILMDLVISLLPICLLYDLQISRHKKFSTIAAFSGRMLLIPLAILRLVYLSAALTSSDRSFDNYKPTLVSQVYTNFSVVAACAPFLIPVVDSLQTGLLTSDLHRLSESRSKKKSGYNRPLGSIRMANSHSSQTWVRSKSHVLVTAGTHGGTSDEENQRDRNRSEDQMIIRQTTTMTVQVHDKSNGRNEGVGEWPEDNSHWE